MPRLGLERLAVSESAARVARPGARLGPRRARRPSGSGSPTGGSGSAASARSGARAPPAARSPSTGGSCWRRPRCSTTSSCTSSATCASRTTRGASGRSSRTPPALARAARLAARARARAARLQSVRVTPETRRPGSRCSGRVSIPDAAGARSARDRPNARPPGHAGAEIPLQRLRWFRQVLRPAPIRRARGGASSTSTRSRGSVGACSISRPRWCRISRCSSR